MPRGPRPGWHIAGALRPPTNPAGARDSLPRGSPGPIRYPNRALRTGSAGCILRHNRFRRRPIRRRGPPRPALPRPAARRKGAPLRPGRKLRRPVGRPSPLPFGRLPNARSARRRRTRGRRQGTRIPSIASCLFCSGAGPGSYSAKYRKPIRVRKKGNG